MHDEERVHLPEKDVVRLDEVACPRTVGMVCQKDSPALPSPLRPNAPHVLLDRALADLDAEPKQLAADALRASQAITLGHIAYQIDGVRVEARPIPRLGPVAPEQAKAAPMPLKNRLGLHDNDRLPPCG